MIYCYRRGGCIMTLNSGIEHYWSLRTTCSRTKLGNSLLLIHSGHSVVWKALATFVFFAGLSDTSLFLQTHLTKTVIFLVAEIPAQKKSGKYLLLIN